jgi:hypothetical protein
LIGISAGNVLAMAILAGVTLYLIQFVVGHAQDGGRRSSRS